jgi:hypothetical protein
MSRKEPKMSTESASVPVALVTGADKGITGPVCDDPHDYTAGDMTEVLLANVVGLAGTFAGRDGEVPW